MLRSLIHTALQARKRPKRRGRNRLSAGLSWPHRLLFESLEPRLLLASIVGTTRNPALPSDIDAVWVTSAVTSAELVDSVTLTYRAEAGTAASTTPFTETFGTTAVKPWTGGAGSDNSWTVTGSYFSLDTSANYVTSTTDGGLQYKGRTSDNGLTSAMVATTSGISAAGTAGYVEFYVKTQTLDGGDGWTFQVDSGSGFVTRLSELTGNSHAAQKYHYALGNNELVNGLQLRFQFTGGGATDTDDRISVDQITVTVTPASTPVEVALLDDGAHGDGAAGDGVYGGQIPAQAVGTTVSYYLTATDSQGAQVVDPAGAPGTKYSYTVIKAASFDGNIVLGTPTNSSIALNILSLDQNRDVYLAYGTTSGVDSQQTATYALVAGIPLVVTLDSLTTDTQYYYRMVSKPAGTSSSQYTSTDEYRFHTQRAAGSTFTFAIQGDSHPERVNSQFNGDLYSQTLLAAKADNPDFYLTIGDDFSVDQLDYLTVTQAPVAERYLIQRPYLGLIGNSAPLFLVNGNHEQAARYLLDGTPDNVAVWAQNARNLYYEEPAPSPDNTFHTGFYTGNTEGVEFIAGDKLRNYFAWNWGDALFVTIDPYWSSPTCVDDPFDGGPKRSNLWDIEHGDAQYDWLQTTLEQSTAKYKFVFAHHVLGTGRGGADLADGYEWGGYNNNDTWGFDANRPNWDMPIHQLMASQGVTAFIQGHDHIFVDQELDGIHYITLPEPADPNYYLYNADAFGANVEAQVSNSGYTRFTVAPDGVQVEYIRTFLPESETLGRTSGMVAASFTLAPASGLPVITGRLPTPYAPTPSQTVWVTSTITDDGSVAGATLTYSAGAGPLSVTMLDDGLHGDGAANDHVYGAPIPAQAAGTMVQYTMTAVDNAGNQATRSMSYTVAPAVTNTTATPSQPKSTTAVWVTSTVTDNVALSSVTLTYQAGTAAAVNVTMVDDGAHGDGAAGDHVYGGQIPAMPNGTTVTYYVNARDTNGVSTSDPPPSTKYSVTDVDELLSGARTVPNQPTPNDPAWVTATLAGPANPVQLYYNASTQSTAFLETFGPPPTSNLSPWTGGGVANPWTVTAATAAHVTLLTGANNSAVDANGGCGVRFLGGTADPLQTMIATANTIDARGQSGTVQFSVKATNLVGTTAGWTFQVDSSGTGSSYVTRLSELSGTNHTWKAFTYTLQSSELVAGLRMRFQFQGGDANDQVQIDDVSVSVKLWTVVAMADDGAHGDGAAGDRVYGAQLPGLPLGTTVSWYAATTDGTGTTYTDPAASLGTSYSYVVGYPYDVVLGRPTNNSIAVSVMSRTNENLTFHVAYRMASGLDDSQTAAQSIAPSAVATLDLTALQPDTQYYYRVYYQVASQSGFDAGPEQSFHTQRAVGEPFAFDVQADIHHSDPDSNSLPVYQATAANIAADDADFLMDLGDTFMTEKYGVSTESGIWSAVQSTRTDNFSMLGGSTPVLMVTGNHESQLGWLTDDTQPSENVAVWETQARQNYFPSVIPGDFYSGATAVDPYVSEPRDSYYAFTWGNAQFLVLDPFWYTDPKPAATLDPWGWTLGDAQYHWLAQTLQASTSQFKFVFIHHLVGGSLDEIARGGVEHAPFFEWGGQNEDGTWGFDTHRPGWDMPIQNLLLNYGVDVVFHGHDHLFVKQNLDANSDGATDLVYLECPQPASPIYDNTSTAAGYGYVNYASDAAGNSGLQGDSGHIRVTVTSTAATIDYVRAYAAENRLSQRVNGSVSYSFSIANRAPTDVSLTPQDVPENQPVGAVVGTLATADPDLQDTFTYTLISGVGAADNAAFRISGKQLLTAAPLDFELKSTYSIRVRTTDQGGLAFERPLTVAVLDVNETPQVVSPISNQTAPANRQFRLSLAQDTFVDADIGQNLSHAVTLADGSPLPGWLKFDGPTRTFSGRPLVCDVGQIHVRVTATDSGAPPLAAGTEFSITVTPHPFAWQNADLPEDVEGNGLVTALDVLLVINWINGNEVGAVPTPFPDPVDAPVFFDVNGDNFISPLDVLAVVNYINAESPSTQQAGEGEGIPASMARRVIPVPPTEIADPLSLRDAAVDQAFQRAADLSSPDDWDELLDVLAGGSAKGGMRLIVAKRSPR
ncbi:MAG: metallophosphoesterase [Planctomycetota bacterium]|nr:metallophosphoesterase [Planctomycetota bacterium]